MIFIEMVRKDVKFSAICALLTIMVVIIGAPLPLLIQQIIDYAIPKHDKGQFVTLVMLFMLGVIVQLFGNYMLSKLSSKWVQKIVYRLRSDAFEFSMYNNQLALTKDISNFQTVILSDSEILGNNFQKLFIDGITSIISIGMYMGIIFFLDSFIALFILACIPIFIWFNYQLSNLAKEKFEEIQVSKDHIHLFLLDVYQGLEFIKLYNVQKNINLKYRKIVGELRKKNEKFSVIMIFLSSLVTMITIFSPFMVLAYGCYLVFYGNDTIGTVIASYTYANAIFAPISGVIALLPLYKQLEVSGKRYKECLNRKKNIGKGTYTAKFYENINYINLESVYIAYPGNNRVVLENKSLFMTDGKIYALRGRNGSGKTTLLRTIINELNLLNGNIDICSRSTIAYIPSDVYVFDDTVRNNLTMGIYNYNRAELDRLLLITGLIDDLKLNGVQLDQKIDNNTHKLSLGQIQKIKLIRALLSDASILLIDEILSNFDLSSRNSTLEYLNEIKRNKIIILVTHEDYDVREYADSIIWI